MNDNDINRMDEQVRQLRREENRLYYDGDILSSRSAGKEADELEDRIERILEQHPEEDEFHDRRWIWVPIVVSLAFAAVIAGVLFS